MRAILARENENLAMTHISNQVRAACERVAGRARSVGITETAIETYAVEIGEASPPPAPGPAIGEDRESRAAFVISLDAINFGSGWWPTIRKREGLSGYSTIEAGLAERFRDEGPWSAEELTRLVATDLATVTGQDADHPLMEQYAASLRDVGVHLLAEHRGSFSALVDDAEGSALALADLLVGWDAFADVSSYDGEAVPFFKRAQIAAADIERMGVAELRDVERLTAFADNLVPHVLRVDGVLRLDPELERKIDAEELLAHGSPEEVELRACAVHAVELLADSLDRRLSPAQIDAMLWSRGRAPRYKSRPRPRSRNTAY
jgi:hypothetical protein